MEFKKTISAISLIVVMLATLAFVPAVGQQQLKGPYVDEFIHRWPLLEDDLGIDALLADELDVVTVWPKLVFERGLQNGLLFSTIPAWWQVVACFNMRRAPMDDRDFRYAMAHVYPAERLFGELYNTYLADPPQASLLLDDFDLYGLYNPDVASYEYDPELAIYRLIEGGYTPVYKSGEEPPPAPGKIENWIAPGAAEPLRTLEVWSPTEWPDWLYCNEQWVAEMQSIGIPAVLMTEIYDLFAYRCMVEFTFDMTASWGVMYEVPSADTLYLNFHSDWANYPWTYNAWGLQNSTVDAIIESMMFTLDENELKSLAFQLQEVLADICPAVTQRGIDWMRMYDPDLEGPPGESNWYLLSQAFYMTWKWKSGPGGTVTTGTIMPPANLNPALVETWFYHEGYMWSMLRGQLLEWNPWTGAFVPWIATDWTDELWEVEPGVTGQKVTFWLRDDALWHDLMPVTAEDVKFTLEYMRDKGMAYYFGAYADLHHINIVDPHQIEIYYATPSSSRLWALGPSALSFPKHIWETVEDPFTFTPWEDYYTTIDNGGESVDLTYLIGAGPFMFPDGGWDPALNFMRFVANRNFFTGPPLRADINYDHYVDIFDIVQCAKAFGASRGDPDWDPAPDIKYDELIDIFDIVSLAKDFGLTW